MTGAAGDEERTLGGAGGGGVFPLFLARCGDASSDWGGLSSSVDGGLLDWARSLATLLSMARA